MAIDLKKNKVLTAGAIVGALSVVGVIIGIVANSLEVKYWSNKNKEDSQTTTQEQAVTVTKQNEPVKTPNEVHTTAQTTTTTTTVQTEPPEPQPIQLMEPYEGARYEIEKSISMGGTTYYNCFSIKYPMYSSQESYMLFNLGEQYSDLEFDIGHIDGSYMHDSTIQISVDKKPIQTLDIKADDMPFHVSIDLKYGKQLKIECIDGDVNAKYGIANATLYP